MGKKRTVEKINSTDAEKNLDILLEEMLSPICKVSYLDKDYEVIHNEIDNYENDIFYKENKPCDYSSQAGRVWILVGYEGRKKVSLTVGQSLDIIDEIKKIVYGMLNEDEQRKKYLFYKELFSIYKYVIFFEVPINQYILREYGDINYVDGIVQALFDMSKEYLVEASIAYNTGAVHWDFYNSGMDKRAHIFIKDKEYEKLKETEAIGERKVSKNTFEIMGDVITIKRPEWDFWAQASVREDYKEEIQSVTWGLNSKRYPYNGKLGSLHSYVMKKWYGEELCQEMKDNDFVIDHRDNVSHNCCINNLCFWSNAWNKAKGYTLDKDNKNKEFIALTMFKDFETDLFQITIHFNYPAKLKKAGFKKNAYVELAYLLYEGDYKSVITEVQSILGDYLSYYEFHPEKIRALDYHIEGSVGTPVEPEDYQEYLKGKHGHGVCFFEKKAMIKDWNKEAQKRFFTIHDSVNQEDIYIELDM